MNEIELFYFDGCPSWQEALENLKSALQAEGLQAKIRLVKVHDDEEADHLKFLGSPSFRVHGEDWWGETRARYNLSCRVYSTPHGLKGAPSVDMLRQKLRDTFHLDE